jgi:hypothetical protein
MIRRINLVLVLLHIRIALCIDANHSTIPVVSRNRNTTTASQLVVDDFVLVETLAYNKSGNINSLSWSSTTTGTTTGPNPMLQVQILVAASVTTVQVWNGTTTTTTAPPTMARNDTDTATTTTATKWNLVQRITSQNIVHAVAISPNRNYLAFGTFGN